MTRLETTKQASLCAASFANDWVPSLTHSLWPLASWLLLGIFVIGLCKCWFFVPFLSFCCSLGFLLQFTDYWYCSSRKLRPRHYSFRLIIRRTFAFFPAPFWVWQSLGLIAPSCHLLLLQCLRILPLLLSSANPSLLFYRDTCLDQSLDAFLLAPHDSFQQILHDAPMASHSLLAALLGKGHLTFDFNSSPNFQGSFQARCLTSRTIFGICQSSSTSDAPR